jgi:PHP family Zn ribbon phosphoesterase
VFELERVSYGEVVDAICSKDPARFQFTIETEPAYGKYHWTGHRKCNVSLSPQEAQKFGNICPVCHRKLTKGVDQRVEELADRPVNFKPDNTPGFMRLLPLSEIITTVLGAGSPSTQAVWKIYNSLVTRFGDEYNVLINASRAALADVVDAPIADAVVRVREGSIRVIPGFDGVYGTLDLDAGGFAEEPRRGSVRQLNLADFW